MCKFWISLAFSLLAIIISGIAIAVTLPHRELCIDYQGVFSGVLSFAITLLLGWNIYSLIDIKKLTDEVQTIKETNLTTTHETLAKAFVSLMNQTSAFVEGRNEDDRAYNALSNGLLAIKYFHLAGKVQERKRLIQIISQFSHEHCQFSQHQSTNIYQLIGQLQAVGIDTDKIEAWMKNKSKQ